MQTQANEIDDLKAEIELLIRKPLRQIPNIKGGRVSEAVQQAAAANQFLHHQHLSEVPMAVEPDNLE